MTNLTVVPARREGISSDEALSYALRVLRPEYQTVEKLRAYALSQVKSRLSKKNLVGLKRLNQTGVAYLEGKLGYEKGEIVDILEGREKIPKGLIKPLGKELKIILEDLLPVNTDEKQMERFAEAYENITGKRYSPKYVKGLSGAVNDFFDYVERTNKRMKLGVVIETLLDAL